LPSAPHRPSRQKAKRSCLCEVRYAYLMGGHDCQLASERRCPRPCEILRLPAGAIHQVRLAEVKFAVWRDEEWILSGYRNLRECVLPQAPSLRRSSVAGQGGGPLYLGFSPLRFRS